MGRCVPGLPTARVRGRAACCAAAPARPDSAAEAAVGVTDLVVAEWFEEELELSGRFGLGGRPSSRFWVRSSKQVSARSEPAMVRAYAVRGVRCWPMSSVIAHDAMPCWRCGGQERLVAEGAHGRLLPGTAGRRHATASASAHKGHEQPCCCEVYVGLRRWSGCFRRPPGAGSRLTDSCRGWVEAKRERAACGRRHAWLGRWIRWSGARWCRGCGRVAPGAHWSSGPESR